MNAPIASDPEARSYDELVRDLESCVKDLEEGKLPLERAIERFKEGVALVKLAEQRLQTAETQVNLLLKGEDGQERIEPLVTPGQGESPRGPRLATSSAAPPPVPHAAPPIARPIAPKGEDDIPF
jgi:exodeoxyribonuclease VII small subunit